MRKPPMKGCRKESRSTRCVLRYFALVVLAGGSMTASADTLQIAKLATYANPERVRVQVREECTPEVMLPVVMREEIIKRTAIQNVLLVDKLPAEGHGFAMTVTMLSLEIPHGTGWSTEKRFMKVKTVLYRNGAISAEIERYSEARGAGNFFQKTFRIRKSCDYVEHLARDVSKNTVERLMLMKSLPSEVAPTSTLE